MAESKNSFLSALASSVTSSGTVPSAALAPEVTSSIEGAGTAVYDSASLLPIAGNTAGDTAFVKSTSRLYIHSGVGWYNVAVINNTPTVQSITDSDGGTTPFALATDGTPTTITITAQDSDGDPLTYNYSADSNFGGLATISQDTNVFTITPFSEDSATTTSGTITFTVTDGINTATPAAQTFGLLFATSFADPTNVSTTTYSVSGNFNRVNRIAFTADNTLLVTSWHSGYVNKYDVSSGLSLITSTNFQNNIGTANISNLLVVGDYAMIGGWDTGLCVFNHTNTPMNAVYSETQSQATSNSSVRAGYGYDLETMPLFIADKNIAPFRNHANPGTGWNGYRWSGSNSLTGGGTVSKIMSGSLTALDNVYGWNYDQANDILLVSGGTGVRSFRVNGATGSSQLLGGYSHPSAMYTYAYDPTTKTYFASSYNSLQIYALTVNSNGSFTPRGYRSNTSSSGWPQLYCKDGFLYAAEYSTQTIHVFSISATADLTLEGTFANGHSSNNNLIGTNEKGMQWNPTGQSLWYNTNYLLTSNNLIKATG